MLEASRKMLANASESELRIASIVAHRYLVTELEQNLIPTEEALRTVDERKAQDDEIWSRTVFGIIMGLRSAHERGFSVAEQ